MQVQFRLAGNLVVIGLLGGFFAASEVQVQSQTLPPPPNVPVFPPSAPLPSVNPAPIIVPPRIPDSPPAPNDRVYAPRINSVQPIRGQFRIYIDSASPFILQQARMIQPDAFFQNLAGRRVIQAGLFTDEMKARQQLSRFAAQGLEARISTRSPQSNFEPSAPQRGYYAVVPGNRSEVEEYRERAVRLGVTQSMLQLRDRPRGLHLAVGPFQNRSEAEQVVQYLRDRGSLDARLFYDR
ncbi:hypothetical protein [Leptolyngbya sp. GGD]|uniref:hypothetical protein n=1 Tax=Leptolyngbya sp. GGD TaxID=2997907 RepID=UPI00227CA3A5|nr:hypothetical protein [Leptolyngbya sp. GGD]MCY6490038.1 hypothetical protein [Leptolyngbya sp. GGD]